VVAVAVVVVAAVAVAIAEADARNRADATAIKTAEAAAGFSVSAIVLARWAGLHYEGLPNLHRRRILPALCNLPVPLKLISRLMRFLITLIKTSPSGAPVSSRT